MNDVLENSRHHLMIITLDNYSGEELLKLHKSKAVAAYIIFGLRSNDRPWLELLQNHKIPFVSISSHFYGITSLDCDNVKGGYIAAST